MQRLKKHITLLFLPVFLYAQTPKQAENFKHAQEMFNPWYAGPLLTGSAHMMPAGSIGLQFYLFAENNYAIFNKNRHLRNQPNFIQLAPQINAIQLGITPWLDVSAACFSAINWQNHEQSGGFGDTTLTLGFPILTESLYLPAMKIGIGEVFPTGRYDNFSAKKASVQGSGQGSCQTQFSYRIAKILRWDSLHPINLRATFTYTIPCTLRVSGFNAYGGGFETRGTVRPGNQFNATFGIEWSFMEHFVLVNDFVYIYNNHSTFTGYPGTTVDGSLAKVGKRSNSQFSLSPVLEYHPNSMIGVLGGLWFTVTGRNSDAFLQGILGVTFTWNAN